MRYILLFVSALFATSILAQPATTGCHFAHKDFKAQPLTAEQQRSVRAVIQRSDTFDVLHYDIELDVTQFDQRLIKSECTVTFRTKMDGLNTFSLDLLDMNIDRISRNGLDLNYARNGFVLVIDLPATMMMGDTNTVTIEYSGRPTVSNSSFGGFYFEGGYAYNLGIDLIGDPHNFGRSWFPCFDNFVERATYDISLVTRAGRKGYAVGDFMGEESLGGDTIRRNYSMQKQLPTYLVGVAVSDYVETNYTHNGAYGDIPVQLVTKPTDVTNALNSLAFLPDAIDCLEYWYGPYVWNRVGYVMTQRGAMEHAGNIAYPDNSIAGGALSTRLMTHELCHHWWGNIITVNYAPDMWVKEGNAEYGAHLIEEFIGGAAPFRTAVRNNHYFVITTAHEEDGAYLALSPLSQENTYGRHTYYRGASVMHNMRAYLGDSLFRAGQQALLLKNQYSYLNAQNYRDDMTAAVGVDMNPFFNDWIFSPGYADWFLRDFSYDGENLQLKFGQNQYFSGHYHEATPVPITVLLADGSKYDYSVLASGAQDSTGIVLGALPHDILGVAINSGHKMNLAMFEDAASVTEIGDYKDGRANYKLKVEVLSDSFEFMIENHLTPPDGEFNSDQFILSQRHFWHIVGNQENKYEGLLFLYYDDNDDLAPDDDLTSMSEDSIVLMYRPNASEPWEEYFEYTQIKILPNDGKGSFTIENVLNGDYTFANKIENVSTRSVQAKVNVHIYPNPTTEALFIDSGETDFDKLEVYSLDGRLIEKIENPDQHIVVNTAIYAQGEYFILMSSDNGKYGHEEFSVIK